MLNTRLNSYRDAITRVASAWVLYPGSAFRFYETDLTRVEKKDEVVPEVVEGVGAIPHVPGENKEGDLRRVLEMLMQGN